MIELRFDERFHSAVRNGLLRSPDPALMCKRQTVRTNVDPSERRRLAWIELPDYRESRQVSVFPVSIERGDRVAARIYVGRTRLSQRDVETFAIAEGFHTTKEMLDYFDGRGELPFRGALVKWGSG